MVDFSVLVISKLFEFVLLFFELFLFGFTLGVLGVSLHGKLSCIPYFLDGVFINFGQLVGDIVVAYNLVHDGLNIYAVIMCLAKILLVI